MKMNDDLEPRFRKALDESPTPLLLDKDWLKLDERLDHLAFMRFKWNRFNVYYLATLVSAFCMATSALMLQLQPRTARMSLVPMRDTVYLTVSKHDTLYLPEKVHTHATKAQNRALQENTTPTIPIGHDSMPVKKEMEPHAAPLVTKVATEPPVSPVVVYKQDTIIRYDSVKVSKRQWRKMRQH